MPDRCRLRWVVICWCGWRCPRIWTSIPYSCGHCGTEYEPTLDANGNPADWVSRP